MITAARVAESLKTEVDPCDDFYTFACGQWMEKNVIPEDRSEMNMFGLLRDEVDVILKSKIYYFIHTIYILNYLYDLKIIM